MGEVIATIMTEQEATVAMPASVQDVTANIPASPQEVIVGFPAIQEAVLGLPIAQDVTTVCKTESVTESQTPVFSDHDVATAAGGVKFTWNTDVYLSSDVRCRLYDAGIWDILADEVTGFRAVHQVNLPHEYDEGEVYEWQPGGTDVNENLYWGGSKYFQWVSGEPIPCQEP